MVMLVQFSVENFLSFDEEQVFSMVAGSGDQHPTHLVPDVPRKGESLLRAAALYGANGAGKSNLVQAMQFAKSLIIEGRRSGQAIPVRPFKLGVSVARPSKFEFIFNAHGILYNYGFRVDAERVLEEWLFATPKTQEVTYFERSLLPNGTDDFEFGNALTGRTKKQTQFLDFVAQGTRPNQLFLTEALERNVAEIKPVIDWFQRSLLILSPETPATHLEMSIHEDKLMTAFMETVLRMTGTGVEGVTTEEVVYDADKLSLVIPDAAQEQLDAQLATSAAVVVNLHGPREERLTLKRGEQGKVMQVLLKLLHRGQNGRNVEFNMNEVSDGTQRLINLIPALFILRQNPDQVVILDELDRRLHPSLSRFLVEAALMCDEEQRNSQLIFTTHDTNLLDLNLLRRDEIWFAEKDKDGASHLYSLAEFKTRLDLKIEKGYLNGRFGAIPFVGDPHRLGLSDDPEQEAREEQRYDLGLVGAAA